LVDYANIYSCILILYKTGGVYANNVCMRNTPEEIWTFEYYHPTTFVTKQFIIVIITYIDTIFISCS